MRKWLWEWPTKWFQTLLPYSGLRRWWRTFAQFVEWRCCTRTWESFQSRLKNLVRNQPASGNAMVSISPKAYHSKTGNTWWYRLSNRLDKQRIWPRPTKSTGRYSVWPSSLCSVRYQGISCSCVFWQPCYIQKCILKQVYDNHARRNWRTDTFFAEKLDRVILWYQPSRYHPCLPITRTCQCSKQRIKSDLVRTNTVIALTFHCEIQSSGIDEMPAPWELWQRHAQGLSIGGHRINHTWLEDVSLTDHHPLICWHRSRENWPASFRWKQNTHTAVTLVPSRLVIVRRHFWSGWQRWSHLSIELATISSTWASVLRGMSQLSTHWRTEWSWFVKPKQVLSMSA